MTHWKDSIFESLKAAMGVCLEIYLRDGLWKPYRRGRFGTDGLDKSVRLCYDGDNNEGVSIMPFENESNFRQNLHSIMMDALGFAQEGAVDVGVGLYRAGKWMKRRAWDLPVEFWTQALGGEVPNAAQIMRDLGLVDRKAAQIDQATGSNDVKRRPSWLIFEQNLRQ